MSSKTFKINLANKHFMYYNMLGNIKCNMLDWLGLGKISMMGVSSVMSLHYLSEKESQL